MQPSTVAAAAHAAAMLGQLQNRSGKRNSLLRRMNSLFPRRNSLFRPSQGIGLQRIEIAAKYPEIVNPKEFGCNALKSLWELAFAGPESVENSLLNSFSGNSRIKVKASPTGQTARYVSNF
jgi:hypothetical protein